MIDREKVIENLEKAKMIIEKWIPMFEQYNTPLGIDCAIAMLKEQEPILLENQHKPYGISTNANSPWISRCPRCGKKVEGKQTRFCKYCGQEVKWNNEQSKNMDRPNASMR